MKNINKIGNDLYYTNDKTAALDKAIELSKVENDMFSVIYAYSGRLRRTVYFIERGCPLVRTNEELIAMYENGEKLK